VNRSTAQERADDVVTPGPPDARSHFLRDRAVPALFLSLTAATLILISSLPLNNTDTFFHLRFGHQFLNGWSLRDPGSVSNFATAHWVPTQWLPEVVMAKTEDWFGLAGVAWLSGVQILALAATLYLVSRRWGSRSLVASLVLVAMSASYLSLSMRPQILSYVFLVVTLGAWLRTRDDGRLRWWLVPLTWTWAMCHGMWPVGIGLGAVALVGLGLDRRLARRDLLRGALIPVASALAAALTPVGPELYIQIIRVQDRSQFFSEWRRPNPASFSWIVLAILGLIAFVLLARTRPFRWLDTILLGICVVCSVWSWRTVPVAAFLLVPLISVLSHRRTRSAVGVSRPERALVLGGVGVALVVLAVCVPFTAKHPTAQLTALDPAADALPQGTKVLSSWDWSGYLMWRRPGLDVLMHGYGDTYTVAELQRNTDIEDVAAGWQAELRKTGCSVAILRPSSGLAQALVKERWTAMRRSPGVVELQAPSGWTTSK
jgi:hypothetical protein